MTVKPLHVKECELLSDELVSLYFPAFPGRVLFARYGVHGDGSCFFHSLCAAVDPTYVQADASTQARMGHTYRKQFKKYLTDERWNQFVQRHKITTELTAGKVRSSFGDSTVWADEIMIRFVSSALKMNIVFIDTNNSAIYCGVHGRDDEPLVVVMWIDRSHFEPLCVIKGVQGNKCESVDAQFLFHPQRDKDVVDAVLHNYQAQCSVD